MQYLPTPYLPNYVMLKTSSDPDVHSRSRWMTMCVVQRCPHQKGPTHQADRHRPRTRHFARYYPSPENQTFRQVLSITREPDISPGIIHHPRTRHFARCYPSPENQTLRQVLSITREPDFSPGIIHRLRTRHFARYYPSPENQTFRQVLSTA